MQKIAKALLCTTLLFVFNHRIAAGESNDITIRVQIFPPQAKTDSSTNNWTVELQLIRETPVKEPNSSTVTDKQIRARSGGVADNNGRFTWECLAYKLDESSKRKQIRYYYKVVCYGGWAYNDGSSKELDVETPNVYEVTIYMKHR